MIVGSLIIKGEDIDILMSDFNHESNEWDVIMRSNRKDSILIITPFFSPNVGGVETHLDDLCQYMRTHGHNVFVITYQPLTTKAMGQKIEKKENLEIHRIRWFGYNWFHKLEPYPLLEFLYLFPGLFIYSLLFFLKHRKEIDVIHAHGINAAFITKFLSKIFKKRSIVSSHAVYNLNQRSSLAKVVRWTFSSFDVILPLMEISKRDLIMTGISKEKMRIYRHWIDLHKFRPLNRNNCKEKLDLSGKFVILFVGRFIRLKGVDTLLTVASKMAERNSKIIFLFVGNGPLSDEIKKKSKILQNVVLVGKLSTDDIIKYYNSSNIFIIPSLYDEPFGRVVLEALACGVPVIAANKGSLPEIVDSSVGVVIEPTVENILRRIDYLYRHPENLKKWSINCRTYVEQNFSEENVKIIEQSYSA